MLDYLGGRDRTHRQGLLHATALRLAGEEAGGEQLARENKLIAYDADTKALRVTRVFWQAHRRAERQDADIRC